MLFQEGYCQPWRRIYDHELLYVVAGTGHIHLDMQVMEAAGDRLFLVPPGIRHSFRADRGRDLELLGVHFDWQEQPDSALLPIFRLDGVDSFNSALTRPSQTVPAWDAQEIPFLDLRGRPHVKRLLQEIVAQRARRDEEAPHTAGALLLATVAQIAREARLDRELTTRGRLGPDAVRRAQRARELLESIEASRLSVEDCAAWVGWSADHLRRVFRELFGASPVQLQNSARLRRAKELLRGHDMTISEVALRCGFETPSHFAQAFKKEFAISPRQWAENVRAGR
ncbi:MAG TPA: AraC family transcriptional regulator [Abditibacteriaceae bacterium]